MSSKGKTYSCVAFIICIVLVGMGIKSTQENNSKKLEHIILNSSTNELIWEYSNNSQDTSENLFNGTSPIIAEDNIFVNDKTVFTLSEDRSMKEIATFEGTIYYYKDEANYMMRSSQRYLKIITDNIEETYYLFDSQFNYLNCRQIVQREGSVLCLSTNLGMIFELQKSSAASRYTAYDKSGYAISGLYNLGGNLLLIYQAYGTGTTTTNNQQSNVILKVNEKEVDLPDNFVYLIIYRNGKYIISTVSESNINNKINSFDIFELSSNGELKELFQNASGVCLY